MRRAIVLAARGAGQVAPNPKVGAVVVQDGVIVGEGWHARYGDAHAEVVALAAAGTRTHGATVYVSLEPCNHHGKTPPCTDALLSAGVARAVFAVADPTPVAGGGADRLRRAGVAVAGGVLEAEARELNAAWLFAASGAARPWVTLKLALSVDGAIVGASRARTMLTGPDAQRIVHELRADADAVAVGITTAIADDAELTVRLAPAPRVPPVRVVFDRDARLPLEGKLASSAAAAPVVVITSGGQRDRESRLEAEGVRVLHAAGGAEALERLHATGVRHLFVEGGAGVAGMLLSAGLVDRLITFHAPVVLGDGALPAFGELQGHARPRELRVVARRQVGPDFMTVFALHR